MQRSTFALGIAAALVFSGFAYAEDVRKLEISYSDLDLSRPEQASTLYSRIQRAAGNVCKVNTVPNVRALLVERQCTAKAMDEAVRDVDHPNLTAVYMAKTGKRSVVASSR